MRDIHSLQSARTLTLRLVVRWLFSST